MCDAATETMDDLVDEVLRRALIRAAQEKRRET